MKRLIVIAVFAALGAFAYNTRPSPTPAAAPIPQIAIQFSGADQVSRLDEMAEFDSGAQIGCTGNCCEINDAGVCVLCRKVCP